MRKETFPEAQDLTYGSSVTDPYTDIICRLTDLDMERRRLEGATGILTNITDRDPIPGGTMKESLTYRGWTVRQHRSNERLIQAEKGDSIFSNTSVDRAFREIDGLEDTPQTATAYTKNVIRQINRGMYKRDFDTPMGTQHYSNVTSDMTASEIARKEAFDAGCILVTPEGWGIVPSEVRYGDFTVRNPDHTFCFKGVRTERPRLVFSSVQSAWEHIRAVK